MSVAQLRTSLALWRARERSRKKLHSRAQADLDRARAADVHPREHLVKRRDLRARQLDEARDMVAKRERQLAEHATAKPTIVTAAQLGLRFQYLWNGKGTVYRGAGHYTAGPRAPGRAKLIELVRLYHGMHPGGLAYEAVVADDGTVALVNPMNRKGAAVASNNTGMVNICVPGTTGDRMTAACKASIKWLLANWHTTKIPKAHRLPRKARGLDWRGHRYHPGQSTACPNVMVHDYKELWR